MLSSLASPCKIFISLFNMYIISGLKGIVKNYFSLGIKNQAHGLGSKILIRISFILHQLHMRACLRAKKTYGLKVFEISNAFGVSRG
jgi:hypothetical protein